MSSIRQHVRRDDPVDDALVLHGEHAVLRTNNDGVVTLQCQSVGTVLPMSLRQVDFACTMRVVVGTTTLTLFQVVGSITHIENESVVRHTHEVERLIPDIVYGSEGVFETLEGKVELGCVLEVNLTVLARIDILQTLNEYKLLIGNKNDLEEKREISFNEGKEFASINGMQFFETSAKTAYKVQDAFESLTKDIIRIVSKEKKNMVKKENKIKLDSGANLNIEKKKCC